MFFALFALLESNSIGISCFDAHHEPSLPIIVLHAILVVAMPLSVLAGSMAFKTANTLAVGEALKPYALRYYLIPTLLFVAVVAAVNLRNRPMLGSEPIEQGVATLLFVCCYMEAVARSYFRHIYPYSANRNAMPIVTSEKRDLWLSALLAMVFAVSVVIWLNYGDFSVPYTFRDNPESYNHNYLVMLTLVAPALVLAYYHYVKRSVWAGFGLLFMVAHTAWLLREERFSPANASGEFLAIAFMLVWFGLLLSIRQYWRIKLFHSYSMQVPALNMPLYMLSRIAMLAVLVTLGMLMPLKAAIDLSRTFAFLGWFL
ncbi:MAG: hypothetical protein CMM94_08635 [Rickettsiales bacterium]|nr:hypothetical protein [Rickettsiales bacterium]